MNYDRMKYRVLNYKVEVGQYDQLKEEATKMHISVAALLRIIVSQHYEAKERAGKNFCI